MSSPTPLPAAPAPGEIVGLAGVIVSTSIDRFAELESFYLSVFGSHVRSRRPGFVNFAWSGARLTVAVHDGVDGASCDGARLMANFAVGDIESVFMALRAMGVRVVRDPTPEKWGGIVGTVADPDGNLIQFLQMPADQLLAKDPPVS